MESQKEVRRNHFSNIHISKAEITRQMAKHAVLLFSHKPENALKAFCYYFTLLAPLGEASYQTEPSAEPPVNSEWPIQTSYSRWGDGMTTMGQPTGIPKFTII